MKLISISIFILILFTLSCDAPESCLVPEITIPTDDMPPSSIKPRFSWNGTYDTNIVYLVETSALADFSTIYESISLSGTIFHANKVYPHDEIFHWRIQTLDCEAAPNESIFRTQNFVHFLSGDYKNPSYPTFTLNQDSDKGMSFSGNCGDVFFDLNDLEYWNDDEFRFYKKDSFPENGVQKYMELEVLYDIHSETLNVYHFREERTNGQVTAGCSYNFSGIKL